MPNSTPDDLIQVQRLNYAKLKYINQANCFSTERNSKKKINLI